jgi:dTDP-4-dehydrorhamnose reductase
MYFAWEIKNLFHSTQKMYFSQSNMQTILVIGSAGQLGNELQLIANQYSNFKFVFTNRLSLDLSNLEQLTHLFIIHQFSYCINAAAYTAVDKAETEVALANEINGKAVETIAKICALNNCLLIHVSTDYVFDGEKIGEWLPTDNTSPLGVYGASKLQGELAIKNESQANPNWKVFIIRTSWVFSSFGNNFVKTMLRLMASKDSLGVVNDQFGKPTYAADLADAILKVIIKNSKNPTIGLSVFHFANNGACSWFQFANEIASLINYTGTVNAIATHQYPTPAKRPANSVLDTTDFEFYLGYTFPKWQPSLAKCLSIIEQNN